MFEIDRPARRLLHAPPDHALDVRRWMRKALVRAARGNPKCLSRTACDGFDDRVADRVEVERHVRRARKIPDARQSQQPCLDFRPVSRRPELNLQAAEDESNILDVLVSQQQADRPDEHRDKPGTIASLERELAVVNDDGRHGRDYDCT